MSDQADELFTKALKHAITAGGLRIWAKRDSRLTRGFTKGAERQTERSGAALNAWVKAWNKPHEGM